MKKSMKWMRMGALVLCLLLCLTACGDVNWMDSVVQELVFGVEDYQPGEVEDSDRRTIPYSEIAYERPDVEAIVTRLTELTQLVGEADSFDKVMEYDNEMGSMMEEFGTMNTLAYLKTCQYTDSASWEEEYRYCAEAAVDLTTSANEFNRAIVEGPYAEEYRQEVGDYIFQSIQNELLLSSPAVQEYQKERAQLNIDYNKYISTLTIDVNGQDMTLADLDELYYTDYNGYWDARTRYGQEHGETYAECYRRMVELDNQSAFELGFGSAADMYYLSYARDYTPADAEGFFVSAKQLFVPMVETVYSEYIPSTEISLQQCMNNMPAALENVDPELVQAWDFMLAYGMYDLEARANKLSSGAFCTDLPAYDTPFIYAYWTDDFTSATTVMHEFGHFYDSWLHYDTSIVFNLDIAECYSQGLEVLLQKYYGDFTQNPVNAQKENLQDFMNPLTYQVMLEEFQHRIYALDTFDVNIISQLYAELLEAYGYNPSPDQYGNDYSWLMIPHLFDAPFYTISYFTSACVALQIWETSQDDWQAGADAYLNMIRADQNQPFVQLVQSAGMKNPLAQDTLEEIAWAMADAFNVERPMAA